MIEILAASRPGLGVAQRSSILVMTSGPYHWRAVRAIRRIPLADRVLAGTVRGFHILLTAGPLVVIERAADAILGEPQTAHQVNVHRSLILSGTAATMFTGMGIQRTLNHSQLHGPIVEAGRIVGSQLSIGAAASTIVVATDVVLGRSGRGEPTTPAAAFTFGAFVAIAQSKILSFVAARIILPTRL